jgi:hypothetical protein
MLFSLLLALQSVPHSDSNVIAFYKLRLYLIFSASMDPNEESVQLFLYMKGEEKVVSSERCNFEGNNSEFVVT